MKKTTKVILSSALTMGLCASLIAGSTLAMFSSRSNVNVAITSGKVDVVASVDTDSLTGYSTEWEESAHSYVQKPTSEMTKEGVALPDNTFYAGGTFTYDAGELKLDSIAPGDAVEFKLNIENNSTLAIQYRVQLTVPAEIDSRTPQGEVVKQLKVSFNDGDPVTIGDESTFAQKWSDPIDKGVAIEETPKVRVELPYELGNDYQGQNCLLHVGVYAVQLGTHVADADGTYNAHTAADLLAISNLANSGHTFAGETIELGADIDLSPDSDGGASTLSIALADTPATIAATSSQAEFGFDKRYKGYEFKGTFNGNGYRISNFKNILLYANAINQGEGAGLFNVLRDATVENLILSNVTIVVNSCWGTTADAGYAGILAGKAYNSTIKNITIENSSVKSTTDFNDKYYNAHMGHGGNKNAKPDYVGALVGEVFSATTVENVKITLNEDVGELIGNETRSYPGYADSSDPNTHTPYEVEHTGNKLVGAGASNVTYVGTSTLVCIPAAGMEEVLTFTQESHDSAPTVSVGSAEGLVSLAQSVKGGRDYSDITITLTEDIVMSGEELTTSGFKGTIDGGEEGHTISGLDIKYLSSVSAMAMATSVEDAPTLRNVTLEFTQFTGVDDWEAAYVHQTTYAPFLNEEKINLCNATIALQENGFRYELNYDADGTLKKVSYIGLSEGNPETGEGYDRTYNDRQETVSTADVEYKNIKFTGNSYFNITGGTAEKPVVLKLDHCLAEVSPSAVSGNSRAAFIASHTESAYVKYELEYTTIRSAQSSYDSFSAAIFSWANTAKDSFFRHNTFGGTGNKQQYTFVAVKLMNFAEDADVTFHDNTVYITTASYVVDTFDLYQNNSRANTYNAYFTDNTVTNVDQTAAHDAYFLFVEANVLNAQAPAHGRVYVIGKGNTLNGAAVDYDSYDPETFEPTFETSNVVDAQEAPNKFENLEDRKQAAAELEGIYQYDFVSWEVALNDSKQIESGTFVLGEDFTREQLLALKAPDADEKNIKVYNTETGLLTVGDGQYAIDSADALVKLGKYVCEQDGTPTINVILTANINLAGVELPEWTVGKTATGTIDGQGHIIYGVKTMEGTDNNAERVTKKTIFGNMDASSTISNISFVFKFVDEDWELGSSSTGQVFFGEVGNLKDVLIMMNQEGKILTAGFGAYWDNSGTAKIFNGSNPTTIVPNCEERLASIL